MFQRVLLDFVLKTFGLGAENGTRTRDLNLGKVALYQLSYFRMACFVIANAKVAKKSESPNFSIPFCKFFTICLSLLSVI